MSKSYLQHMRRAVLLSLVLGSTFGVSTQAGALDGTALPTGEENVTNATVSRNGAVMDITQTKGKQTAYISWGTFNIGKDATVNVKQHTGADTLINAVRGNDMSEIAGKLNASGNVVLVNPNGVVFHDGAQVNVGGLGVYATGYNNGITNSGDEGNIVIEKGATINAGVGAALSNINAWGMASDYAIAIDSTADDGFTDRIHLVAEGNVEIQDGSTMTAKDSTYVGSKAVVGAEGFTTGAEASGMSGKIYIRTDRDSDDYGSLIVTHGTDSSSKKPVIESARGVSIYANAPQADGDTTKAGIQAASRTESDGTVSYYTKRDYQSMANYSSDFSMTSYTDGSYASVEGAGTTADKLTNSSSDANYISNTYAGTDSKSSVDTRILINNMDQLQDIADAVTTYTKSDGTTGTHITGNYVLGRTMNAKDDEHSFIDNGILYKIVNGSLVKMSINDRGTITYDSSKSTATKTMTDGTTLSYADGTASTAASTTETISQKGTTVTASNTSGYSTDKGSNAVTSGSTTYTVSGKAVMEGDFTSQTNTNTVKSTSEGYTVVANGNTQTVTSSDGTVSDIKANTVTKIGGTEGTSASITTHSDTEKKGSVTTGTGTYSVDNTTVSKGTTTVNGNTVTLNNKASTVDLANSTVDTSTASTSVTAKDTKTGTVTYTDGGQAVSVDNGTASYTASDGTSYTVKTGSVTTSSGDTSKTAAVSDTAVTVDDHSVAVSGGKTTGVVTKTETVDGTTTTVSTSLTGKTITKGDSVIGVTVSDDGTASASTVTTGSGTGASTVSLSDSTVTFGNGTKVSGTDSTVTFGDNTVVSGTTVTMGTTTAVVDNTASTVTIGDNAATVNGNTVTVGDATSTIGSDGSTVTTGHVTVSGKTVTLSGDTGNVTSVTDLTANTVKQGDNTYLVSSATDSDGNTTRTVTLEGSTDTVDETTAAGILTIYDNAGTSVAAANEVLAYKADADSARTAYTNSLTAISSAKTAISHAKDVSTDTDVSSIWTGAKAAKADADTALSAYALGTGALSAMDSAVSDLKAAATAKTNADSALTTFNDAVSQLETDITRYKNGVTTLSSAKTALSNYTSLQSVLTRTADLQGKLSTAYSEFQSSHLTDTTIKNINSANWNEGKGFQPIGTTAAPFAGNLDGFSGETTRTISNLTIHRGDEDNVGLAGVASGAGFGNIHLDNAVVQGASSVGAIAGSMTDSWISWSSVSGSVRTGASGKASDIGGLAGKMTGGSIGDSVNNATVTGTSDDKAVDVSHTGGVAGSVSGGAHLTDVRNAGVVIGEEDTGGIAGYVKNSQITGSGNQQRDYYNTYNAGTVTGDTNTGGIAGRASGIYLYGVFNTNEDTILSTKSQIFVDAENKVIRRGDGTTTEAGTAITDDSLRSTYGTVSGNINTGGLVGYLEKAEGFSLDKVMNKNISSQTDSDGNVTALPTTITENVLDTVYNAGNVKGEDTTGGLVGKMDGGTISNAYNGDNNTVLREELTIPAEFYNEKKQPKTWTTPYDSTKFTYSPTKVSGDQDATQYYSFFTLNSDGTKNYYYFIPAEVSTNTTTGAVTSKGAGGIFVHKVGNDMRIVTDNGTYDGNTQTWDTTDKLPGASSRYYMNRIFNKDANVTGKTDTGGLVGNLSSDAGATAYGTGSVITSAYDSGTVSGTTNTGALVGTKDANALVQDSFFVTDTDASTGKAYSGQTKDKAIGNGETTNTKTTDGLTPVQSKQKYSVGGNGTTKRGNFPAMQQDTKVYYAYTAGSNSYLTDVDVKTSFDKLTTIYSKTTDNETSKTTVQPTYTRDTTKTDGIYFKDANGAEYKATYSKDTNQIVLAPADGNTGSTVTMTGTEESSGTQTYYKYATSNGSYLADADVEKDGLTGLNTIYSMTTTTTLDTKTGKNVTSTTVESAFTRDTSKTDGIYFLKDGTEYKAAYSETTNQIVLTPVDSSTSNTVTFNAVLKSRSANETWVVYENQTTPLLTYYLNNTNLNREFTYDGTTHNLKTDDVDNLYGRADFDGEAGKAVQLSNFQLSTNGISSEYTYDNTSIWSPQHGYFMDPESTLIINPVNMTAKIIGKRMYGDLYNTKDYYVCVPYTANNVTKYAFYEMENDENGKATGKYKPLTGTELDDFFKGYATADEKKNQTYTEDMMIKKAADKGFYVLELNGFVNGEGALTLDGVITGLLQTLSNSKDSGHDLQHLFTKQGDTTVARDSELDAGIYKVTNEQITGLTATNENYTINYDGELEVDQVPLYYTYEGSRVYGQENKNGEHHFYLVGVDSGADTDGNETSIRGYLKNWDYKNSTFNSFFSYSDATKKYEIDQDHIGITGYQAVKTTTTHDVTKGTSETTTEPDETKSASLDAIYDNLKGKIDYTEKNDKLIGSYSESNKDADLYSHVLVDSKGKVTGYKVTTFKDGTNQTADGTIQLVIKDSGTTGTSSTTDTNTASDALKAAIARFNNNYKLTWVEGGTADKVYTTYNTKTPESSPSGFQTGKVADGNGLTIADSTFTINPITATVTITGQRTYGEAMSKNSYNTSVGESIPQPDSLTGDKYGQFNFNINAKTDNIKGLENVHGLVNNDGVDSVLNKEYIINTLLANEEGTGKINGSTHVGEYDLKNKTAVSGKETAPEGSLIDVSTKGDNHYNLLASGNYDYKLENGNHSLLINRANLTVNVTGTGTYGTALTGANYTVSADGLKNSEGVALSSPTNTFDANKTVGAAGKYTNSWTDKPNTLGATSNDGDTATGTYINTAGVRKNVTTETATTDGIRSVTLVDAGNTGFDASNYNITYKTSLLINPAKLTIKADRTRTYGDATPAIDPTGTEVKGLMNGDTLNNAIFKDDMGTYADAGTYTHTWTKKDGESLSGSSTYTGQDGTATAYAGAWTTFIDDSNSTFKTNNYDVDFTTTYTVNPRNLRVTVDGQSVYGDKKGTYTSLIANAVAPVTGEGLVKGQQFKTTGITVTDDIDETADAGTYTRDADGTTKAAETGYNGITAIDPSSLVDSGNGNADSKTLFKSSNYNVILAGSTHTVTPKDVTLHLTGTKTYGNDTQTTADGYTLDQGVLSNQETFKPGSVGVTNRVGQFDDVGDYTNSVTALDFSRVEKDNGDFKAGNYHFTYTSDYKVTPRTLRVTVDGQSVYGDAKGTYTSLTAKAVDNPAKGEGLVNGQQFKTTGISVTDDIDATSDAGTYTRSADGTITAAEDGYKGISAIDAASLKDNGSGSENSKTLFKSGNYHVILDSSTHTVTPKDVTLHLIGTKTYGNGTQTTADGYTLDQSGLSNKETFKPVSVGVTNRVGQFDDVGDYTNSVTALDFSHVEKDNGDFKAGNYHFAYTSDYTVTPRTLRVTVDGRSVYGDAKGTYTSLTAKAVDNPAEGEGLVNGQQFKATGISVTDDINATADAGTYTRSADGTIIAAEDGYKGISAINAESLKDNGSGSEDSKTLFKSSNYDVVLAGSTHTVTPKDVTLHLIGTKTYGNGTQTTADGYTLDQSALSNKETFKPVSVGVTNRVGQFDDVGDYTNSVTALDFSHVEKDNGDFKAGNYHFAYTSDYTVTPRTLRVTVDGQSVYGDKKGTYTSLTAKAVDNPAEGEGLVNGQQFKATGITVTDDINETADAGTYTRDADGTTKAAEGGYNGITAIDPSSLADSGSGSEDSKTLFKISNYNVILDSSTHTVTPKDVTLHLTGTKTYGNVTQTTADGYTLDQSVLSNKETFKPVSVGVTNRVGQFDDVGDYTNSVTALDFSHVEKDNGDFKAGNYRFAYTSDYKVTPRTLRVTVDGRSVYGDAKGTYTSLNAKAVDNPAEGEGLVNGQQFKATGIAVTDDINATAHAGTYTRSADGTITAAEDGYKGISAIDAASLKDNGNGIKDNKTLFKNSNYNVILDNSTHTVDPAALTITISGSKDYGQLNENGSDYNINISQTTPLQNGEKENWTNVHINNTVRQFQDKGTYYLNRAGQTERVETDENGKNVTRAILGINEVDHAKAGDGTEKTLGFDPTNYSISYSTEYKVNPKGLTILTEGSKTYGDNNVNAKSITFTDRGGSIFDRDKGLWDDYQDTLHQMIQSTGDFNKTDLHAGTYGSTTKTQDIQEVEVGKPMLVFSDDQKKEIAAHFSNYNVSYSDTATVNPKAITIDVSGKGTYGDTVSTSGKDYTIVVNGGNELPNKETFDHDRVTVLSSMGAYDNGGTYSWEGKASTEGTYTFTPNVKGDGVEGKNVGITGIDKASMHQGSFDPDNYDITYSTSYSMQQRPVTFSQKGTRRMGGLPAYTLFDPMTVTNVPDRDRALFYDSYHREDVSEISTAAGFHLGHISPDGTYDGMIHGWFTDPRILNNYAISGDTSLQITPSKDLDAAISLLRPLGGTPARRPILDIRYLTVEGNGINRNVDSGAAPAREAFGEDRDLTIKGDGIRRFGSEKEDTGELILTRDGKKRNLVDEIYHLL